MMIEKNLFKNCLMYVGIFLLLISTTFSITIGNKIEQTNPLMSDGGLMNSSWPMFHHDTHHTGRSPYAPIDYQPAVKWKFLMHGLTLSSPAIDENGTIYIGSDDFQKSFYAINSNGTEKWHYGVEEFILSSPTIGFDNTIYVGANNGNLYAFYPNGVKKWSTI